MSYYNFHFFETTFWIQHQQLCQDGSRSRPLFLVAAQTFDATFQHFGFKLIQNHAQKFLILMSHLIFVTGTKIQRICENIDCDLWLSKLKPTLDLNPNDGDANADADGGAYQCNVPLSPDFVSCVPDRLTSFRSYLGWWRCPPMCTAAPWVQDKMCNWLSTCQIRRSIESSENWYLCSHLKRQLASSKCCCCILSDLPMCSAQLEGGKIEVDSRCNWHSGQGEPTLRPQIQQRRRRGVRPHQGCTGIATVQCTSVHPVQLCTVCNVHPVPGNISLGAPAAVTTLCISWQNVINCFDCQTHCEKVVRSAILMVDAFSQNSLR